MTYLVSKKIWRCINIQYSIWCRCKFLFGTQFWYVVKDMHGNALSGYRLAFLCVNFHQHYKDWFVYLVELYTESCDIRQITETTFGKYVRRGLRGAATRQRVHSQAREWAVSKLATPILLLHEGMKTLGSRLLCFSSLFAISYMNWRILVFCHRLLPRRINYTERIYTRDSKLDSE
jgi:hypothetical protein